MTATNGGREGGRGTRHRLRRRLWSVAEAMASPRRPEDYLDMFHPLRRGAQLRGKVVAVRPEAGDAVTVVLRPGAAWRPHLAQRLAAGDLVHLDQACGDFVLPDPAPEKVLFITGGSGITPVIGMLRSGLQRLRDVVLVHSDATHRDVIFGPELRELAAGGRIRLVEHHTERAGRLAMAELRSLVPDLAERETWACGPAGLLDRIESYWTDLGSGHRLHTERFRTKLAAPGEGGTVDLVASGVTVDCAGTSSILEAAE